MVEDPSCASMKAAATLAYNTAIADGCSQEDAKAMARKVRESWTISTAAVTPVQEAFKACVSCRRSLPRTAFSGKQWLNKKFRGESRRCSSCLLPAGVDTNPNLMASVVAGIALRGGIESFSADWTEAWQQVLDEAPQASGAEEPRRQGRHLALLIRNLDSRGASKAEKTAARALAEECWTALGGRSQLAQRARPAPRTSPAVDAGWAGGAGLLATTDTGRGKAGRGGKALAAAELAAAVTAHAPTLGLGADIATDLIFLPCKVPGGDGALAVERALSAIRAASAAFAHVHRCWAVCETATTATDAALAGRKLLARALQARPDATFAIRCEAYPPPASQMGRSELVVAIAAELHNAVDLASPDVCLLLRGVHIGGELVCAVALELRDEPSVLRCEHGDDSASEGRPYFVRNANGATPPPQAGRAPRDFDDGDGLAGLVGRLEAALTAAAILSPAARHALYRTGIDADTACASAAAESSVEVVESVEAVETTQPESLYASGVARRRHRRAAGSAQSKSLSTVMSEAGLLVASANSVPRSAPGSVGVGLPRPRACWTVEFGAGAGELSRQLATDGASLATGPLGGQVLLDRSCGRGGSMQAVLDGDRWEEKNAAVLSGRTLRLRVDIRHVHLPGLAELQGAAVTAVGKHVCGAATDLMLRSVVAPKPGPGEEFECRGVGIALCCHHLCTSEDYVNPGWVQRAGLSRAEFRAVCRLSSWANIDRNARRSRQRVGLTCKAFLDVGRCLYLRERGFDARLVAYCSADETPENRLLLATRCEECTE